MGVHNPQGLADEDERFADALDETATALERLAADQGPKEDLEPPGFFDCSERTSLTASPRLSPSARARSLREAVAAIPSTNMAMRQPRAPVPFSRPYRC